MNADQEKALSILENAGLLTPENREAVLAHQSPCSAARGLCSLKHLEQWKEIRGRYPSIMEEAIASPRNLENVKLLTPKTREALLTHQNPESAIQNLDFTLGYPLLTSENLQAILAHASPRDAGAVLVRLNRTQLLTAANREIITDPRYRCLFTEKALRAFWYRIPDFRLTQGVLDAVLAIVEVHATNEARINVLQQYTDRLLNPQLQQNAVQINGAQSTHTVSVHRTVSESAKKLRERYGKDIQNNNALKQKLAEIKRWVRQLPNTGDEPTNKNAAAKRCIECITAADFIFEDPGSNVSIPQALALVWIAIHDNALRQGSLEDALVLFVDGLYEIQRGYNLSDVGIDDCQTRDLTICVAGTFNKLFEKVGGLHPDVTIEFITRKLAAIKLQILIREKILEKFDQAFEQSGLPGFLSLLHAVQDDIRSIWLEIKDTITDRLFDEFSSLYRDNRESSDFKGLIDAAEYSAANRLPYMQKFLVESRGYHAYCSHVLRSGMGFFGSDSLVIPDERSEIWDPFFNP